MNKKLLLIALPLVLCASAWGVKRKLDAMPAAILARYPQDTNFRMVTRSHLKLHSPELGMMASISPRHPLLLTSNFMGSRTNVIKWCYIDADGRGTYYREVIDWAIQAQHPVRWDAQQISKARSLLKRMPPSAAPKSRDDLLIVSFDNKGKWETRIYNKKAAPLPVQQLFGLMGKEWDYIG